MSDPHDGPLAESNEAKFARVMKELATALRIAHEANSKLSSSQAAIHALVDLGIAARVARLVAAAGLDRGLLPALRDLAVLIPCLDQRAKELRDTEVREKAHRAILCAWRTREALLEITDALYPR